LAITFESLSRAVPALLLAFALKAALIFLVMPETVYAVFSVVASCLVTVAIAFVVYELVDVVDHWITKLSGSSDTAMDKMLAPLVCKSLRVTIVVLTLLQIGTIVSDKPLTSLLAGLGIG